VSLTNNITEVVERIAEEFKTVRTMLTGSATGDLSSLPFQDQNLLNAVMLTYEAFDNFALNFDELRQSGQLPAIEDSVATPTTTYSSSKIDELIASAGGGGGAAIDDVTASTTTVYSSSKVDSLVDGAALVTAFNTALNS
jgi:hypothetical protein